MSNKLVVKKHFDMKKVLKKLNNETVKVGFPKGNAETTSEHEGVSALEKATINNFGLGNVPARPFMKISFYKNQKKYKKLIVKGLSRIEKVNYDTLLGELGVIGVNDIQSTITSLQAPANTQSTIDAKGSSNPLIDSGHLRQSVTYSKEKIK